MKILVLGGTGAMGSYLVPMAASAGHEVFVTSRSAHGAASETVCYMQGDAHDPAFLERALRLNYDVIVDFMAYSTEEFRSRRDSMLSAAKQYIFLSSSRVYAASRVPITEDAPRLITAIRDEVYLRTDEYALAKARQEDLLFNSGKKNWTIVRPYITYSDKRLQLGVFEKELWLWRAIHGQTIIFPEDIASHTTTITWGEDVAKGIVALLGNQDAMGRAVHITTSESIRWDEVLELYQRVFRDVTGMPMKVKMIEKAEQMRASGRYYQTKYDRLFDRTFDNTLIRRLSQDGIDYVPTKVGLERCLREFLEKPEFRDMAAISQAWMDRETREFTPLSQLRGYRRKMKYLIGRYTPYFRIEQESRK